MKFGILSGEPLLGRGVDARVAEDLDGFRPIVGTDFPVFKRWIFGGIIWRSCWRIAGGISDTNKVAKVSKKKFVHWWNREAKHSTFFARNFLGSLATWRDPGPGMYLDSIHEVWGSWATIPRAGAASGGPGWSNPFYLGGL